MAKARESMSKTDKAVLVLRRSIGLLGGAFAAFQVASFVKAQFAAIDALGKTADTLGLTVKQLDNYRHAAELAGVSTEGFDKSFQRFVRNIGDFRLKGGPTGDLLKSLGLSESTISGGTPSQVLLELANAFKQIEDPAKRVSIAFQLFGREGVKMVKLLEQGKTAILAQGAALDIFGDALSRDAIAKVEEANDAYATFYAQVKRVSQNAAVAIAPTLQATVEEVSFLDSFAKEFVSSSAAIDPFSKKGFDPNSVNGERKLASGLAGLDERAGIGASAIFGGIGGRASTPFANTFAALGSGASQAVDRAFNDARSALINGAPRFIEDVTANLAGMQGGLEAEQRRMELNLLNAGRMMNTSGTSGLNYGTREALIASQRRLANVGETKMEKTAKDQLKEQEKMVERLTDVRDFLAENLGVTVTIQ